MNSEDQIIEYQTEWVGSLMCRTSDGRIVNMADELNRLESEMKKLWDKVEIDQKFESLYGK